MATVLMPGTKLTVFAIRRTAHGGTIWSRAGNGFVNKDASVNVWLDALPIDGQLHVREAVAERKETGLPPVTMVRPIEPGGAQENGAQENGSAAPELAAAGGES